MQGTVKWFDRHKGYGFIEPDTGGGDIFVHYSAIEGHGYRNLQDGERVSFTVADTGRGPAARDVRLVRPYPMR